MRPDAPYFIILLYLMPNDLLVKLGRELALNSWFHSWIGNKFSHGRTYCKTVWPLRFKFHTSQLAA